MSEVDSYVSGVDPKLRSRFEKLRSLVKMALPEASESIKWGAPYYALDGTGVASIAEYSEHVNLYLMQGARLSSALLKGTGRGMRHVTVKASAEVDEAEVVRLLREAGALASERPRKSRGVRAR